MRFILFVEGYTEAEDKRFAAFLKRWLDPQLRQPVGISPIRFEGWPELVKEAPLKARLHLQGRSAGEIVGVIGLIDLQGPSYPAHLQNTAEKFDWVKQQIEHKVGQPKFRQFCAVHEIEAWLLSQPELFPREVREAFPSRVQHPETINFDEPPSRLLDKLYRQHRGRSYKKRVNGPDLFAKADPRRAYDKSPTSNRCSMRC